ncbi:MAG: hypothetical protein C0497_06130 [Gemmatimonas sp.]|nr:hypothetical protein [Gemmatimonas sp.]
MSSVCEKDRTAGGIRDVRPVAYQDHLELASFLWMVSAVPFLVIPLQWTVAGLLVVVPPPWITPLCLALTIVIISCAGVVRGIAVHLRAAGTVVSVLTGVALLACGVVVLVGAWSFSARVSPLAQYALLTASILLAPYWICSGACALVLSAWHRR